MTVANILLGWLLLSGLATLIAWPVLRRRRRVGLAVVHVVVMFIAYNLAMPPYMDIRVDLLLTVPLVLVIIVLGVVHLRSVQRARSMNDPPSQHSPDHRASDISAKKGNEEKL